MTTPSPSLGGRLRLLSPEVLRPEQKRVYDAIMKRMVPWAEKSGFQAADEAGHLLGPFNCMLVSPRLGEASLLGVEAERAYTSLPPRIREIILLPVGAVWGAAYELYAHTAVAATVGLHADTIQSLVAGKVPEGLSEEETVAHEFTHMLVAEHQVDARMYNRAVAAFGEKGLADLIFLAGNYMTVSALLNAFDVPVPPAPSERSAPGAPALEAD